MHERFRRFIRNYLGYFTVTMVSAVYIATAFVTIDKTNKTIGQIIADGVLYFIFGILKNRVLDIQGLMNGEKDPKVVATMTTYGNLVDRVTPFFDKLTDWCDAKNAIALRNARMKFLAIHGMNYKTYFSQEGELLGFPFLEDPKNKLQIKDEKKRYKNYIKCLNLKLTPLTPAALTSDGGRSDDPYYFGRSKQEYEKRSLFSDLISKIVLALIVGYYGVQLVQDFSFANLIWTLLQVVLILITGALKMMQSYWFVTDEHRASIIKKIGVLQMFENDMKGEKYELK